jgi:hypothetical protein
MTDPMSILDIPLEALDRIGELVERLRRGEHAEVAQETGSPDVERLAFKIRPDGSFELPHQLSGPQMPSIESIAALLALAEAGISQNVRAELQATEREREFSEFNERFTQLWDKWTVQNRTAEAQVRADQLLVDLSRFIDGVKLDHRDVLGTIGGIYMEFSIDELLFSYTDRDHNLPALHVSSTSHYKIIEFELEIDLNGITVDQLDRIERARFNASWEGYHHNINKYLKVPSRLAQIYTRELLDRIDNSEIGTGLSIDVFGGEGDYADAKVLNIEAYRLHRDPHGLTGKLLAPGDRDAAIIDLVARFPGLGKLLKSPDDEPSA